MDSSDRPAPDPVTGRRRKVVRGRTRAEAVRRMRQVQLEVARAIQRGPPA